MAPGFRRVCCAFVLSLSGFAAAQTYVSGFNLERLDPDPSAQGSLVVGSGRLLPPWELRLSLLAHYENDPLVAYQGDAKVGALVKDRVTADLLVAYALGSRLELGAQIPMVAYQTSDAQVAGAGAVATSNGLGTPVGIARLAILRETDQMPLDLAVHLGVGMPVGSANAFAGDGTFTFAPKLLLARELGPVLLSAELGGLIRPAASLGPQQYGNQLTGGAAVSTLGDGLRVELAFRGAVSLTQLPNAYELIAGLRVPLSRQLEIFVAGGPGLGVAPGTPTFRALAGLAWGPRATKTAAAAPAEVPAPPALVERPAPPPPKVDPCAAGQRHDPAQCPRLDDDGDGVPNAEDRCPLEKGPASNQGCPVADRDHDGVPDAVDKCPDEPGPAERQGCPFRDRDNDGIEDSIDACPDQAGPAESRGCPIKDSDGDGVPDNVDNCPKEPGPASNQGCPVKQRQLVIITREKLIIKDKVYFATNKATLLAKSNRLLDQIAKVINEHPSIPMVVVEGHTDNRGRADVNRRLSQARADAVRAYLIRKGVDPSRVEARGYGPDRPAEPNTTAEGREANRRVEFNIVDQPQNQDLLEPLAPTAPAPKPKEAAPPADLLEPLAPTPKPKPAAPARKKKAAPPADLLEPLVPSK